MPKPLHTAFVKKGQLNNIFFPKALPLKNLKKDLRAITSRNICKYSSNK